MNTLANPRDRRQPGGGYVRRSVHGHGSVRAVWVRAAGSLAGREISVVARTFASVVLDLGADHRSVVLRPLGERGATELAPIAVGFDAHAWAGERRLDLLEREVRRSARRDPGTDLREVIRSVLDRSDVADGTGDDDVVRLATSTIERDPPRRAQASLPALTLTSPRTLRRRFHATTGLSAEGYRVVARAARARTLLDSTVVPLAEIAWRLGYADQSHFHRHVLAHSGYTPTAWRERGSEWHVSRDRTE